MVLTWKNVDAPNLNGAGALIESANSSFNSAMETLRQSADRSRAKARSAYSAQMLQQLAGVTQAEDVGSFLQGFDATRLSPEALEVAMRQPGILLDRSHKQLQIEDAQGDLAFEKSDRVGRQEAGAALIAARQLAMSGDKEGAFAAMQAVQNPYATTHLAQDVGLIASDFGGYLGNRQTEYDYGRATAKDQASDFARDTVHTELLRGAASKDQASIMAQTMARERGWTPQQLAATLEDVNKMPDEDFQRINPDLPGMFETDSTLAQTWNDTQLDTTILQDHINNRLASSPMAQMERSLSDMRSDEKEPGTGHVDPAKYLTDTANIGSGGWDFGWSGINNDIDSIKSELANKGINVERDEVAAAIKATAQTSGVAFRDGRVKDTNAAIDLLTQWKDGTIRETHQRDNLIYQAANDKLSEYANKIATAERDFLVHSSKGNTDKAVAAKDRAAKLMQEQSEFITSQRAKLKLDGEDESTNNGSNSSNSNSSAALNAELDAVAAELGVNPTGAGGNRQINARVNPGAALVQQMYETTGDRADVPVQVNSEQAATQREEAKITRLNSIAERIINIPEAQREASIRSMMTNGTLSKEDAAILRGWVLSE